MDWRDKAACLTVDPELFFPVGNTGPAVDQIEKAKTVCATCTVRVEFTASLRAGPDSRSDATVWASIGSLIENQSSRVPRALRRATWPAAGGQLPPNLEQQRMQRVSDDGALSTPALLWACEHFSDLKSVRWTDDTNLIQLMRQLR